MVREKKSWRLPELYALPQVSQITRLICVEGWSAIGKWSGARFSDFLQRVGADLSARYVGFKCADDYYTSIDMATALHPQTILAFKYADQVLPPKFGFPMKLRIPTKLGFKNPKHIAAIFVTNDNPAATGKTRATTGSAGPRCAPGAHKLLASEFSQFCTGP